MKLREIDFIIDCDSNSGLGHLNRCIALANTFDKLKIKSNFYVHGDININFFIEKKIRATKISISDQNFFLHLAAQSSFLLIDSYQVTTKDVRLVLSRNPSLFIAGFDDNGEKQGYALNSIINASIGYGSIKYPGRIFPYSALGPQYQIISDKCIAAKSAECSNASTSHGLLKIVLTMGGADPDRVTRRMVEILKNIPLKFECQVILGPKYGEDPKLESELRKLRHFSFVNDPPNYFDIIRNADLVITACGTSVYELIFLGIPFIAIATAKNQLLTASALSPLGLYIGYHRSVNNEQVEKKLVDFMGQQKKLPIGIYKAFDSLDGQGVVRLADRLLNVYHLFRGKKSTAKEVANEYELASNFPQEYQRLRWGSQLSSNRQTEYASTFFPINEVKQWLDIGCGSCSMLVNIASVSKKPFSYTGIDISQSLVREARLKIDSANLLIDTNLLIQDFMEIKTLKKYDFISCLGVLQNCGYDLEESIMKIGSLLDVGGRAIISTKNIDWIMFDRVDFHPDESHAWFGIQRIEAAVKLAGMRIRSLTGFDPNKNQVVSPTLSHTIFIECENDY